MHPTHDSQRARRAPGRLRLIAAAMLGLSAPVAAATLVDRSPDAIGFTNVFANATNYSAGQNFLVGFTVARATSITGFSIYSTGGPNPSGLLGAAFVLNIRADDGGRPADAALVSRAVSLSAVDNVGSTGAPRLKRLHAAFAPVPLAAGAYWIGMASQDPAVGWNLEGVPGPGVWWMQGGARVTRYGDVVRFAYTIEAAAVPEPGAWTLMIAGFGLVGAAVRRKAARGVAA